MLRQQLFKKIVYPPSSFMKFFGELTPQNILPFIKYFLALKMIYFIFLDLFYEFF
jgi:hypothetical protein